MFHLTLITIILTSLNTIEISNSLKCYSCRIKCKEQFLEICRPEAQVCVTYKYSKGMAKDCENENFCKITKRIKECETCDTDACNKNHTLPIFKNNLIVELILFIFFCFIFFVF